jgi:hypothetical protein
VWVGGVCVCACVCVCPVGLVWVGGVCRGGGEKVWECLCVRACVYVRACMSAYSHNRFAGLGRDFSVV